MSGSLYHKPSEIIARALIAAGLGTPPSAGGAWPIFNDHSAPEPDNLVCVYDTSSIVHGQTHIQGKVTEHYGIQLKVRAKTNKESFTRIQLLTQACDEFVKLNVLVDSSNYTVWGMARRSGILSLGPEASDYVLWLHTVNYTVSISPVS